MSTKRPSKLKRSLSWLLKPQVVPPTTASCPTDEPGGELEDDYEYVEHDSSIEKQVFHPLMESQGRNLNSMTETSFDSRIPELLAPARPPPFFYPRRLAPAPEFSHKIGKNEEVEATFWTDDSNTSVASSEIASWRNAVSRSRLVPLWLYNTI
jgi:hypothetical protein